MTRAKVSRLTFGKHQGERLDQVPVDYLRWLAEVKPDRLQAGQLDEVRRLLAREPARDSAPGDDPVLDRAKREKAQRQERGPLEFDPQRFGPTAPDAGRDATPEAPVAAPTPANIYHRVRHAQERLDDREWCAAAGGYDAAYERVKADLANTEGVTPAQLLELLRAFPAETEWAERKYNPRLLWGEREERRKVERAERAYAKSRKPPDALEEHEVASLFPLMTDTEYRELRDDIRDHGKRARPRTPASHRTASRIFSTIRGSPKKRNGPTR